MITDAMQDYLYTILKLEEDREEVRSIDNCERIEILQSQCSQYATAAGGRRADSYLAPKENISV